MLSSAHNFLITINLADILEKNGTALPMFSSWTKTNNFKEYYDKEVTTLPAILMPLSRSPAEPNSNVSSADGRRHFFLHHTP